MEALIQELKDRLIDLTAQGIAVLPGLFLAIVIICVVGRVARVVRKATRRLSQRAFKSLSIQSLIVQISYVTTWTLGILLSCVLAFPSLNLSDIFALVGFGSVAVGFAFQDISKNFLAGILLLIQEPFSIGDQIIVKDYEGTVSNIALRSTQLRTYQGEQVVLPNSLVFTSPVQVMTGKPQRRTDLDIGVDYNTDLSNAVKVLEKAVHSVDEVRDIPSPEVDIVGFGSSSIDLVVRYWTHPEQKSVRRIRTQVMIALKRACDQAGITIPYPIRTVYHFDQQQFDDAAVREDVGLDERIAVN